MVITVITLVLYVTLVFCFTTSEYAVGNNSYNIRVMAIISGLKVGGKEILNQKFLYCLQKALQKKRSKSWILICQISVQVKSPLKKLL